VFNLFLIIAAKFLGAMRLGKQCRRIELQRLFDYPKDPVTIYRMILLLAAAAMTLCCGAGALDLWGVEPGRSYYHRPRHDGEALVRSHRDLPQYVVDRLVILGEPGGEHQLSKAPLRVHM
jgi:hypothetical protein